MAGRPPKFATVADLQALFDKWKAEFSLGGVRFGEIPDVEGFCDYADAYRDLLSEYESKPEFSDTIKRIKNWIYYRKKQLAMAGKMNPAVFIFDAKNNANYVDKTEVDQHHSGEVSFVNDVPRPNKG
jgi:hypothetical protein